MVVTVVLALILSWLGGSAAATLIADWARGDESFILAFMAIPLAGLVVAVVFLVASTRPVPALAINRVCFATIGLLALLFAALSVFEIFVSGSLAAAWRGVQLYIGVFGSIVAVVLVQWLIFRLRSRPVQSQMLFGRGPGASA
ncbi:hypothetical protein [Mesorhizobium sp. J428]|uniref:hypothetical protein n=1 Tax=Mesorhizobium sp. J428 TaxID=2898440 RepID=UPI002150A53F|nr:hypothetical protein [Mesorhizobium sp. J428]MCR5859791.1 hypothetical protein [Mesorhizobium sp. J428]